MSFSIGELASRLGVSASAIRYYESEGLLPKADRKAGQRVYYYEDIGRLKLLLSARTMGFGIKELKALTSEFSASPIKLLQLVKQAAIERERLLEAQILQLKHQQKILNAAQSCLCQDLSTCSTMADFSQHEVIHQR